MCGIVGYTGEKQAVSILLESLEKLEYRGYDSAGIAVLGETEGTEVVKKQRKAECSETENQRGRTNQRLLRNRTYPVGNTRYTFRRKCSSAFQQRQKRYCGPQRNNRKLLGTERKTEKGRVYFLFSDRYRGCCKAD